MTIRLLVAMLLGAWAVEAQAISLNVQNCSGIRIRVQTYNNNDTILFAPFASVEINNYQQAAVACGTNTCKLKVYYGINFNSTWTTAVYSSDVCASGPENAELPPVGACSC